MLDDAQLTREEKMIRDSVREYVKDKIAPVADEYDRKGPLTKKEAHKFMKGFLPFGLVCSDISEELGGPGLTKRESRIASYELLKVWMSLCGIMGISSSVAGQISKNELLRKKYLPGMINADLIGCFCLSEPDSGSDPSSIQTTAVDMGDHYVVNGTKLWISNGTISDLAVVVCREADQDGNFKGIFQIVAVREESPYEARDIHKIGFRAFPTSEVVFKDCRIPKENVLHGGEEGFAEAQKALIGARIGAASVSCALAEAALERSIDYAKTRIQFGKPIGKNQMIQQIIAEMATDLDAAKLITIRAMDNVEKGILSQKESSMAKAFATEMGIRVTSKAIQVHGAYGLTEEYPLERYFRDARVVTIPDGTTQIQQLIIARELLGINAIY